MLNVSQCSEYICLDKSSIICTVNLCYVRHQTHSEFWHVQRFFTLPLPEYLIILSFVKIYSLILWQCHGWFRFIQAYSAPCVNLAYSQLCHILNPGMFITGVSFKTLWNVDQVHSEPRHRALFSHIQAYSELVQHLHMKKTGILGMMKYHEPFHNYIPIHHHNPAVFTKIYEHSGLWRIKKTRHIFRTLSNVLDVVFWKSRSKLELCFQGALNPSVSAH